MKITTHEKIQKKKVKDMLMRLVCLLLAAVMIVSLNSPAMAAMVQPDASLDDVILEFCDNWDDDFDFDSLFESFESPEFAEPPETAMIYYFGWDGTTVREVPLDYLNEASAYYSGHQGITALGEDDLDIVVLYYFGGEEPVVHGVLAERLNEAILEHMNWDGISEFQPPSEAYEVETMYYFDWDSDEPQVMNIDEFYELVYPSLYMESGNNYNLGNTGITPFNVAATLNLSASSWTSSFNASSTTIQVTSNRQWTINNGNLGWVRVENITPANRTGNGSFRLTTSPNPGTQSRSGTITVTAPGAPTRTISVTQQGHPPSLNLSTSSWSPTSAASSAVVTVNANGTWSISSNQSWLTITNITPSTRTGGGFFTMNAPANPNSSTRSATVSVTVPGVPTRTITVSQAAHQANLAVSSSGWHLQTHHSSQATVNVTSNGNWTVSSNQPSWLTVSRSSGSGNASFVMSASANTGSTARNGTITVSIPGVVTRTIPVSQAAEAGNLSLSLSTWTPSNFADSINVNVFSNRAWNVSSNATSWLTVTPSSGSGNSSFRINATANNGTAARSGTITVSATGTPARTISVTQGAQAATLNLSHSTWSPASTASSQLISVTSNRAWSVSSNATSWLTVSPASGSNNGSFTINATANAGANSRSGTITVTATGAPTRTISVSQAGVQNIIITLMLNGGSGIPTTMSVLSGTLVGVAPWPLPTPDRLGYTFLGWFASPQIGIQSFDEDMLSEGLYNIDFDINDMYEYEASYFESYENNLVEAFSTAIGSFVATANRTLHAHWSRNIVTVTFNLNGGQGNAITRQVQNHRPVGELPSDPTRAGYTFMGWFTQSVGGIRISANTVVSGNTTYWAQWSPILAYTITLNANGGSVNPATVVIPRGAPVGSLPTPTRAGHAFVGWFTDNTWWIQITATTPANSDMTLVARWEAISFTFDSNGGASVTVQPLTPGMPFGQLPTPVRQRESLGRRFVGWFTTRSVGGTQVTANTIVPNHSMNLYARWVSNTDSDRHLNFWYWSNTISLPLLIHHSLDNNMWHTAMDRGRLNWNRSEAPVYFAFNQSSNNIVNAEPRWDSEYLGWLQVGGNRSGRQLVRVEIYLNSRRIFEDFDGFYNDYVTLSELITIVLAHELGHAVGLEDHPPARSIMHPSVAFWGDVFGPTPYDIDSVRMIYD
ncbi:MAG: InlB B-repeat-containing protein [Defluviitaleaceae bacterium]|nr:InlB B-repeat-containing protein [Defluviitaleaceae bacterium]